ncbi:MAG: type II/IV secretion system protein [Planctomycetes bacterium]|nr:type II/IV secretion system protein [Planctomycetota bacterium]
MIAGSRRLRAALATGLLWPLVLCVPACAAMGQVSSDTGGVNTPYANPISHIWLVIIICGAAFWLAALDWINKDAEPVKESPHLWNLLFFSTGVFSFCVAWLLPYPVLSAVLFAIVVGGTYTTYVVIRNAKVPYDDKVWTSRHLYGVYRNVLSALGMRAYTKTTRGESKRDITEVPVTLINRTGTRQEAEGQGKTGSALQAVKYLIYEAVQNRVTDVHLEPKGSSVTVRYRIDGILHNTEPLPRELGTSTISAIKVLCAMDISERRRPQDGAFSAELPGKNIDIRVATNPSVGGERMMMRILDRSRGLMALENLGMTRKMQQELLKFAASPNGMMVVTGPTGHGKTTSLYALLNKIDAFQRNVITIEDPVEYRLENISQTSINSKAGITFANSLRSMLRQDPDVILVGEIRDSETAEIAMQAAMTGHLVFTTVHAADAVSVIFRLLDLGIQPYLISAAVTGILSQRLIRMLCNNCKAPYRPKPGFLEKAGLPAHRVEVLYKPVGCERCQGTGFYGRTGIFELLTINDELRDIIRSNPSVTQVYRSARKTGMRTFEEDGLLKVARGITSVKELLRVTRGDKTRQMDYKEKGD